MAVEGSEKQAPVNPCCQLWRNRCSQLQEKRSALRQALKLFEQQLDKVQAENLSLKKACEEERARAEVEKVGREQELAARDSLENEISALKSEISILQKRGRSHAEDKSEDVKLLQVCISDREKEINRLKELLEKEKKRADSEKKNAEAEKKRATEAWKYVKVEKSKADEERKLANTKGEKAKEYRLQLEAMSKEVDDTKAKLHSVTLKLAEGNKKLEAEKQKATKERKHADAEMNKAQELRKLAEANRNQAETEKCRAESLSLQLEETRHRVQKEKCLSNQLSQRLEEATGKIDELQKQIYVLQSCRKMIKASAVSPEKHLNADSGKMKLMKKQLKFEKMQVKHAKQVAKLEKRHNIILREVLCRLKLDLVQFSDRLDLVDKCFSLKAEGIDNLVKEKVMEQPNMQTLKEEVIGVEPFQSYLQSENELLKPCYRTSAAFGPLRQTLQCLVPSQSLSGGNCCESFSGIDSKDSKLESLVGGSSRKMLQSCAINSSSASFSDGLFMGSQGKGASSVTTCSKFMEESLNAQPTISNMSGEVNKMRCKKNLAVVTEDNVRSPLKISGIGNGNGFNKKRKRSLDAIESIELLHSEGKQLHLQMEEKLSDFHCKLNRQVGESLEEANNIVPKLQENSFVKHERCHKKKKTSHKETVGIQYLLSTDERKKTQKVGGNIHEDANLSREVCQSTIGPIGSAWPCAELINDSIISDVQTNEKFEEMADGDFMKLLDLDNPVDEECYRTAMEMPLSPTLPEIEFQGAETSEMSKSEPLAEKNLYNGLSDEKENMVPSCSFEVINAEINSNDLKKCISTSLLYENEGPVDSYEPQGGNDNGFHGNKQAGKACDHLFEDFGLDGVISDPFRSRDGVVPFESEVGPACNNVSNLFIVLGDFKDNSSISRIYCATKSCMDRCLLVTQTEWILQKLLLALKMEENLLSKEKASVLFSLLLLNFSITAPGQPGNILSRDFTVCSDSFARHVHAVMSDAEARSMLEDLSLDELLSLIEDFLVDGRVMKCTDGSSATLSESNSKVNVHLDGANAMFSFEAASADQVVAGSIILASISASTNHIAYISEAAYNVSRTHRNDPPLLLTVLHILAYLGGEEFVTLAKDNLTMTVVKSIVTYLERRSVQSAETSCLPSTSDFQTEFLPCVECPFAKDAVSVDFAISLLLEKLKRCTQSETVNVLFHEDETEQICQDLCNICDMKDDESCSLKKYEMPTFQSESVVNMTLCHVTDVLSLMELLACNMRWDWTCTKIIPELLRMLESPMQESFTVAIVILLGQLGRLRVNACGYEDKEVESFRSKLSTFLWRDTATRASLPVQIAIVSALLGLLSLDFEQIIKTNKEYSTIASQSIPAADHIKKWFSSLSNKNQALSFSLLQCPDFATKP
ncbi:uncharacterized protein LOC123218735 [Mangifera indica]|uniref:uncharacterized protein LOC123218735 n=1 Tax=Mangifera indica TaxID=29780 RepID=UPI001CF95FAF|nr:uncharacterized protein LOC123218735 [Mangifera indica]